MGLEIKRNKKGLYKAKSTISGESLSDGWMTEDEFKKILIERVYFKFVEDVIKIDMEFPSGYYINEEREIIDEKHCAGGTFIINNWKNEGVIDEKFREICERLNFEL